MPVKFVSGDLFETPPDVALAHGCNCAGAMGKGIAVEFKRRWPLMYSIYKEKCEREEFTCGEIFVWKDPDTGRMIFNLGTQRSWKTKATLETIEQTLRKASDHAERTGVSTICMPMVGAGLGGVESSEVRKLIHNILGNSPVLFVICENYVAGVAP